MDRRLPTSRENQPRSPEPPRGGASRGGVLAPSVRLVLAVLGAVAGYQLGDRVRISSYAPHLDQVGKVGWILFETGVAVNSPAYYGYPKAE